MLVTALRDEIKDEIVGEFGGSELFLHGNEIRLRPAAWGNCFYAKIATYIQFGFFAAALFLMSQLEQPVWPVLLAGLVVIGGYPLYWEARRRMFPQVIARGDSGRWLLRGNDAAPSNAISLTIRRDLLCGNSLYLVNMSEQPERSYRIMGHLDTRPLDALAEALEKLLR